MMIFISMTIMLLGGMVVDVARINMVKQRLKRACDAAALAGVRLLPNQNDAEAMALDYMARNGYPNGSGGAAVTTAIDPYGDNPNWFRVTISYPFKFSFGSLFGLTQRNLTVYSTAQYNTTLPISINLFGVYGQDNPKSTLAIRGHDTLYEHGDPRATETYDNGDPNPLYDPKGYNYRLYVPANYAALNGTSMMKVELWDPDSYGDYDSSGSGTYTTYTLYRPDSTPKNYNDDVQIASYTYGSSRTYSGKWNSPSGFTIDTAVYGSGIYRMNVKVSSGYNANGFTLRAGPTDDSVFNSDNGTKIMSDGPILIRFNTTGSVVMELGNVPASAAGSNLHIKKFDTDIGSTQITYTCSTLTGSWSGDLGGNAEWTEDIIALPNNYAGGTWYASYYAGITDVSYWELWYEGINEEETGSIYLVE
jgi:hypothetical protein